jgi:D-alanyl-D-alanine carboxypeptidase (penicillin-binding protein 5/6)
MKGLALPSGNDAAVAVAEHLGGTVEGFVRMMNDQARRLGMASTRFVDASGVSARNISTASDLIRLCRVYVREHPQAIERLHSLTEFAYPRPENLPQFALGSRPTLTRENHNELLGRLDGVRGLKTGYIIESGYNIALFAERGAMRLLGIILGGPGEGGREGALNRAIDSTSLLTYGFYAWSTVEPALAPPRPARVYGARGGRVAVAHPRPLVTVRREHASSVTARIEYLPRLRAPLRRGDPVGRVVASLRGRDILSTPVVASADAPRGSLLRRLWDGVAVVLAARPAGR